MKEENIIHFITNTPKENPEEVANMLMEGFDVTALATKIAYDEYLKVGFSEEQAFELTKIFSDRSFDDV